jgi:hypothetical protein
MPLSGRRDGLLRLSGVSGEFVGFGQRHAEQTDADRGGRVVFAGFHCLRRRERRLPPEAAEIVAVSPTDSMPYLPLLPEVGGGIVTLSTSRCRYRCAVADPARPGARGGVDLATRTCQVQDLEGGRGSIG